MGRSLRVTRADDDLDEHLDAVLIGGREERERERIQYALGETARLIEHIGSTVVPGLAAKAIGDIMGTVEDP